MQYALQAAFGPIRRIQASLGPLQASLGPFGRIQARSVPFRPLKREIGALFFFYLFRPP